MVVFHAQGSNLSYFQFRKNPMHPALSLGLALLLSFLFGACDGGRPPPSDPVAVEEAIALSSEFLADLTGENGRMAYRFNLNPTISVTPKYNILRHAGTLYAMCMAYEREPDANLRAAIGRAGRFLRETSIRTVPEGYRMRAVWSIPEINGGKGPLQAKLGGTGLGLVALLRMEKSFPGSTPLSELQSLARFILFMQKEDGSFYSKYIPSQGGRWDNWTSLYYPGEAALGLAMLHAKDGAEVWKEAAFDALAYLANRRKNEDSVPADHWALLATETLLNVAVFSQGETDLLIDHAVQICQKMIDDQIREGRQPGLIGGFSKNGKTTPAATRLEGLLAAQSFLPSDNPIQRRMADAIPRGISFLLRAQITEGEYAGAFTREINSFPETGWEAKSSDRPRATEVRIDYVQHALSAMILFRHSSRQ